MTDRSTPRVEGNGAAGPTTPHAPDPILGVTAEDVFRRGTYPYRKKLKRKEYEARKAELQIELLKLQAWVRDTGQRIVSLVRGPRCRGQGRHHQALHGAPQPAAGARRRAGEADGARTAASGTSSAT